MDEDVSVCAYFSIYDIWRIKNICGKGGEKPGNFESMSFYDGRKEYSYMIFYTYADEDYIKNNTERENVYGEGYVCVYVCLIDCFSVCYDQSVFILE